MPSWDNTGSLIVILIPAFNDWEPAALLLRNLDAVVRANRIDARVLLIDDGSTEPAPASLAGVSVLRLRRNLGHQRAIAVGLVHVYQNIACDAVVVMDGDGEDKPEDVPRLLAESARAGGETNVFAARADRKTHV